MSNTHIVDPRENTVTKQIYNHKCEVYFCPALLKYYPDEKDRDQILKKIEDQFHSYESLTYYFSYLDYKKTEIVWRSEYIEEINILWIGVNINKEHRYDSDGNKYIDIPEEAVDEINDFLERYQKIVESGKEDEFWDDFFENHPANPDKKANKKNKKIIN